MEIDQGRLLIRGGFLEEVSLRLKKTMWKFACVLLNTFVL